jgi:hypothetical protein
MRSKKIFLVLAAAAILVAGPASAHCGDPEMHQEAPHRSAVAVQVRPVAQVFPQAHVQPKAVVADDPPAPAPRLDPLQVGWHIPGGRVRTPDAPDAFPSPQGSIGR